MKRYAVGLGNWPQILMITDHRSHIHRVIILRNSPQQIMQTMTLLGYQNHGLLRLRSIPQTPPDIRAHFGRDLRKTLTQLVKAHANRRRAHSLAGKKPAALRVGEKTCLCDPAANIGNERRQFSHNSRCVGAAQGKDILAFVGGGMRSWNGHSVHCTRKA
jgi:hypothetical protein